MAQRTLYFKNRTPDEITAILNRAAELAQAFSVGTAADDLLSAVAAGRLTLIPLEPTDLKEPPQLTLTQALERAASALQSTNPVLAEELRKRLWLITAAMQ